VEAHECLVRVGAVHEAVVNEERAAVAKKSVSLHLAEANAWSSIDDKQRIDEQTKE
jgi:hypothetical protein